eukprot:CAMPEP_0197251080 /NCGR_PEP_ID=MMETSP1429-20130617/55679_1 /TAXON_ID=49237 /ORGANISM="Chaetoceros  sp., Strain UNC1202" /LENGTH=106 /DNA_ID=CAMNT_0042713069 /DNA_START=105 /DNA_END=422 /DNA_ORIENTATION=-
MEDCRQCWKKNGVWNEDVVYRYLRRHYWPREDLDDADITGLAKEPEEGATRVSGRSYQGSSIESARERIGEKYSKDPNIDELPSAPMPMIASGVIAILLLLAYKKR